MDASEIIKHRAKQFSIAFPLDEPCIPITGLTGEVESDTARSIFRICRLCGALVLESMTPSHLMAFDHDRDRLFESAVGPTQIN